MKYEYGIAHTEIDICSGKVETTHRKNMNEDEANKWIEEWENDLGRKGAFVKIRRPISDWEIIQ